MKMNTHVMSSAGRHVRKHQAGVTLLEVILAIAVFAFGMLALVQLQGNVTRSSSDANARSVASNIAEQLVEDLRGYESVQPIVGNDKWEYLELFGSAFNQTVPRGGLDYAVTANIHDFWWDQTSDTFIETEATNPPSTPAGLPQAYADFKLVEMTVSWDTPQDFFVNDGNTVAMGSGSITVFEIIPSSPPALGAKIAADLNAPPNSPIVDYTPGQRPNIVAVDVNDSKFKESTTPRPDVIRQGELAETWFDVITYNRGNEDSYFLRREEFVVLTCECALNAKPADGTKTGFLPTVWNGYDYTEGEWVSKAYGESANNQQSTFCDTCCRDHHDSPNHTDQHEVYDPSRLASPAVPVWSEANGLDGDHKHFKRESGLQEIGNNENYVEACRMVRKDGFMRVAQDFRQEGFISFPAGYLDTPAGVSTYSTYVTDALNDYYAGSQPDNMAAPGDLGYDLPADRVDMNGDEDLTDATTLPLLGISSQQLRSRGIYIDYRSPELLQLLTDLAACGYDAENGGVCAATGITDPLQALPFYEIQTTWLSTWASDPIGLPVSVTSEDVADDNTHDRGLAVLENPDAPAQTVQVTTDMHRGNIGLTVTDEITPSDLSADSLHEAPLYIAINGGSDGPPPPSGYVWSGTFTSNVNKVESLDTTVTPTVSGSTTNTFCQHGLQGIQCSTPFGQAGGITITGYAKKQGQDWLNLWICVSGFSGATVVNSPAGLNNSATIAWGASATDIEDVVVTIEDSACSP